ncbi:MAG TPA: hypothetical protein VG425_13305, partial [Casimicrobiaceae bacterium]|nr:hypothetical protein [Casimicrobiaceae bacterium]
MAILIVAVFSSRLSRYIHAHVSKFSGTVDNVPCTLSLCRISLPSIYAKEFVACCVYELAGSVVVELAPDYRKCTDTPPRKHLKRATFRTIHHTNNIGRPRPDAFGVLDEVEWASIAGLLIVLSLSSEDLRRQRQPRERAANQERLV